MAAGRKEQTGPREIRSARENNRRELPIHAFQRSNGLLAQWNIVFLKLEHRLGADLGPITASHHIGHPVLHHDGKFRSFIGLPICGYLLASILETVAVKTMMDRNSVEILDPREFGKLVNNTRCKKDFRSGTGRAVRTDKIELFAGWGDGRYPRPAHTGGRIARQLLSRYTQEVPGRSAIPSEQAVDRARALIALMTFITKQCFAVASSEEKRAA